MPGEQCRTPESIEFERDHVRNKQASFNRLPPVFPDPELLENKLKYRTRATAHPVSLDAVDCAEDIAGKRQDRQYTLYTDKKTKTRTQAGSRCMITWTPLTRMVAKSKTEQEITLVENRMTWTVWTAEVWWG